jgi:Ca2+-binding EF-hand superfamily protein
MDMFQVLDRTAKGWITAHEVVESLSELGMYVNKEDAYMFVRRWDRNSDGRITYSEFTDAFVPRSTYHASMLTARKAYYLH